ncbi:MAG: CocE/NonD family hydrolase, partial [Pseudomonadota bacterium]
MRDGVEIAVRIYRPAGPGPFPVLYAASPYRYD